ncbi:dTDP-4-amino-4,6-dideoxygalactose transaminase [Mongoliitalea lutea]|uniref:dTDP-4-amino-4,6-dideoxy-D-glucose transaminase n=1 Tax=Mongoliitalea lutea TaxID=849756 RepID=A0A8J3G5K6_9BACT|nr:dTDP-4-amino-4,6-dideoxygalactose transaminase [Mongoliitalea lutea]GHB37015.1 dTDP-4-amino-4,6-dideoxy-D-glucose transaminase [Mongoliitalea lutea]
MNFTPFNKPYLSGKETSYIQESVLSGKISGDGMFTHKCHEFFKSRFGFQKCLLTTSCTDALEMAAILIDIQPGDEVIMPSYTFVSTANAFVLRGAKIIFCDSRPDHPGMDEKKIEALITSRTKAIIPVHYAGVACDMSVIMELAKTYDLFVIEDAAQAIDSYYTFPDGSRKPLGGIGHLSAFSFHETKNIISGEGGMLVINDARFNERAEIIREKGTNRSKFFRGEVDKYGWVDLGSSFLPSDIIAAFLYAQLESIGNIQERRKKLWNQYFARLSEVKNNRFTLPVIPSFAENNAHMFYLLFETAEARTQMIAKLKEQGILSVFHYQSLHKSTYYQAQQPAVSGLLNSDRYTEVLLRLPMFYELSEQEVDRICDVLLSN